MRVNKPITNKEVILKKGTILVSRTDLLGRITYVNDAFVEISGFTREELIGQEHNIVRHPDMPSATYEDLWMSLKQQRPWQGLVKNRCKNGDYYWIEANAMPLFKHGKVHEYISVRHPPERDRITAAERLYKDLSAGKVKLRPSGWAAIFKGLNEAPIKIRNAFVLAGLWAPLLYLMYRLLLTQEYDLLAAIGVLAITTLAVNISMIRAMTQTLEAAITICYRLSSGSFGNKVDLNRNDQWGDFLRSLYCMEIKLGADLAEVKQEAAISKRITQALDNVQNGVMVSNKNLEIIYMNNSVRKMFKTAEPDIRKQLPDFTVDRLMHSSIDLYHKDPSSQRGILENLPASCKSELVIADRYFTVIIGPVNDDNGERIGYVAEWNDRTPDVLIEEEIKHLVQDVKMGDLSTRINLSDKHGFAKVLSSGINELTDVIESVFSDVNKVMESMAQGNLTTAITNDYQGVYAECKNNINSTIATLSEFIVQIRDAADFIEESSQEMAAGNNNLSLHVEQQAASLQETAANMEQLAGTVRNNADNTQQANHVVNSTMSHAQQGGDIVKSAIASMQDINESSNQLAEIISVIDEIAFQTNLLALNASVEAARAGENGRGFSVVATEVRNLAQRSAIAAQQSNDLIQNSVQKVRTGTAFVNETGAALTEIVESVARVGEIVSQIAGASTEQTAGIDQVNQAVAQMDDITQQNAALAEQAAAGSIAMSEQSTNMTALLSFFKVT
ncbi:MAG: methyl-accepting chemotaxis protein [Methylococcaceae bacterium]